MSQYICAIFEFISITPSDFSICLNIFGSSAIVVMLSRQLRKNHYRAFSDNAHASGVVILFHRRGVAGRPFEIVTNKGCGHTGFAAPHTTATPAIEQEFRHRPAVVGVDVQLAACPTKVGDQRRWRPAPRRGGYSRCAGQSCRTRSSTPSQPHQGAAPANPPGWHASRSQGQDFIKRTQ